MVESPKIFSISREPCLSNFSTIFQKGADSISDVNRLRNDSFTVTPGMHFQISCIKITQRHLEYLEMFRGTRAQIFQFQIFN